MIDIHTHMLPGIDDGSQFMDESVRMAHIAYDSGTDVVVLTPHCNADRGYANFDITVIREMIGRFRTRLEEEDIDLELIEGMEILLSDNTIGLLERDELLSINKSRYYLVEFGFDCDFGYMEELLSKVISLGKVPVVAHPERYSNIQGRPSLVKKWLDMGCLIQANKGSVAGRFVRQAFNTVLELLDEDYITCIASDAHGSQVRTNDMESTYIKIKNEFGKKYAEKLFDNNPRAIINNIDIRR